MALIDCMLIDWGFPVAFSERSCLVAAAATDGGGEDCMEIDHGVTQGFKKSECHEQIRKRNPFTALEA